MTKDKFEEELIEILPTLQRYAFSLTSDKDSAEDLMQDAILRALNYREKYKSDTNFTGWVCTMMYRLFINERKRPSVVYDSVCDDETVALCDKCELQDIYIAIDALPDVYGNIFRMYIDGYKYRDIAEELSISIGTVKRRIHFCRNKLRNTFVD